MAATVADGRTLRRLKRDFLTGAELTGDELDSLLERALALNPSSADIAVWFAAWSGNLGEPERGAQVVDQALRLNPRFPPWYRNAMREAYFFSGRFEDAA
ncbi:hypothetical protein QML07_29960, partial [Klebsiella pneumoniae]|uniref:hypothetical protein n=1 Tax=Klebsiella pneumoniae TaxID=573 RepID=UPI003A8BCE1C